MIVAVRADMAVGSGSESYEVPMAGVVLIRCLCRLRFKKKSVFKETYHSYTRRQRRDPVLTYEAVILSFDSSCAD